MANDYRCGCAGRAGRNSNTAYGCLNSLPVRCRPWYPGPCPDVNGDYDDDCGPGENRRPPRRGGGVGIFTTMLPVAVAANGLLPLVNGSCVCGRDFSVNSGMITVNDPGTYLATCTLRLPEGAELNTTLTLNVNDASQSSAIIQAAGPGPDCYTAQALFDVNDRATLTLRSSEAISITQSSPQPLITLSLVRVDD